MTTLIFSCLAVVIAFTSGVWLLSLVTGRISIIDAFWGPGFVVVAVYCLFFSAGDGWSWPDPERRSPQLGLAAMTSIWGMRLGLHLGIRIAGEPHEDRRYAAMRARRGPAFRFTSLWIVFWLQGVILWIVALPLQLALPRSGHQLPAAVLWVAAMIWLTGFLFEAIGDWQLVQFRQTAANRGRLLNRGLWKYTRHPNYFGDFLVWWGLWLFSLGIGAPLWSVISPVIMSILLMKFSGVGLLEKDIADRRPEYADYVRTTSAFIPRWRR